MAEEIGNKIDEFFGARFGLQKMALNYLCKKKKKKKKIRKK
jgi:hypothetical protein